MPAPVCFEPKWDGYRVLVFREQGSTSLWSRQGKELTRYFPEVQAAAAEMIPDGCVVDGEAVVWSGGGCTSKPCSSGCLPGRAGCRPWSATFRQASWGLTFLGVAGQDARGLPLLDRRMLLEELSSEWSPPLSLSPQTTDRNVALQWFEDVADAGLEGIVAKSGGQQYTGGRRIWLKAKHVSELDVVCGAVIGPIGRPTEVVAGLPIGGELRIVGRSSRLKPADSTALARWLRPANDAHPWPQTVEGTALDRFNRDASPVELTLVEPVVVEMGADAAWSGRSFRHALRFRRARPELDPAAVEVPERLRSR